MARAETTVQELAFWVIIVVAGNVPFRLIAYFPKRAGDRATARRSHDPELILAMSIGVLYAGRLCA